MRWLHEHGVTDSYEAFLRLPVAVLEDCRLLMEAEARQAEMGAAHGS